MHHTNLQNFYVSFILRIMTPIRMRQKLWQPKTKLQWHIHGRLLVCKCHHWAIHQKWWWQVQGQHQDGTCNFPQGWNIKSGESLPRCHTPCDWVSVWQWPEDIHHWLQVLLKQSRIIFASEGTGATGPGKPFEARPMDFCGNYH